MKQILNGEIRASARDRIEAGKWLADRGEGKAPEVVLQGGLEDSVATSLASLEPSQLEALARALAPGTVPQTVEGEAMPYEGNAIAPLDDGT